MDKAFENLSLLKDIQDIDDMLNQYFQNGSLDRKKAIAKIRDLRITNEDIGKAEIAAVPYNFIPFNEARNDQLASVLNAYKAILSENYLRNMQEDPHANT